MKRIVLGGSAAAALAAAALATSAGAGAPATPLVNFDDDSFDPRQVTTGVRPADPEIVWQRGGTLLEHDVRQDDSLFRSGPPSPDYDGHADEVAAGKYHYYCTVHGSEAGGMDGVLRVEPSVASGSRQSVRIAWADRDAERKHRYDVQFKLERTPRWRTWMRATKRPRGRFGARNEPVNLKPGRAYSVRARTFVKGKRDRRSGWSPVVSFGLVN
jgi:plastocyanin